MSVGNFTSVLQGVDRRVQVMRQVSTINHLKIFLNLLDFFFCEILKQFIIIIFQFQQLSRGLESRDYNLLISNMSYVSKWSMIQMLIVIICGVVQVYFVKKLFQDPRQGQGKSKARI